MQAEQQGLQKMLSIYVEQLREKPSLGYVRLTMVEAERLIAALSHPSTPQGWISVDEKLPPLYEEILICGAGVPTGVGMYMGHKDFSHPKYPVLGQCHPTHWMPLPPPPEQGGRNA